MALVPVVGPVDGSLVELEDIGSSAESLGRVLESQKSLFHSQAEQLQKLVVTQCKLTGVNPLSQDMAAGALSIKIGKKPKDLLNPKAIKYMQSIFSIKDTIGKKETREISALCGITVTQVRDYFSSQRSRVRKLVNLSREKASVPEVSRAVSNGCYSSPDQTMLESTEASTNTVDLRIVGQCAQVPGNVENITAAYTEGTGHSENSAYTQVIGHSGNAAYTQVTGHSGNAAYTQVTEHSGNAAYTQVTGHSGNAATLSFVDPGKSPVQIPMNSGNMTTVCTQVIGSSCNVAPVCTQVVGHSENVATVYTQVPGNLCIVSPLGTQVPGNLGSFGIITQNSADVATVCAHSGVVSAVQEGQQNQVETDLKTVEGGPSNALKEETTPGVDSDDKRFLENIFNLMRKEQTFSGQMKLMEWVLQIHNSAVLNWFSTKGGITILASWLSQAALEEQTTVLLILFKVLCHLPLHKALPAQMSAILQTVNRLRFYRTSDISNRARKLLSRWSKMFIRSQALKNPSRNPSKNTQDRTRKDRISEILGDESWQSKIDFPEEILALTGSADDSRKPGPKRPLKLLGSSDGATKNHGQNVSSSKAKERRKAQLVEHPDQKTGGGRRAAPSNHSRPMSADDIQKAKMRAMFMQDRYGKPGTSAVASTPPKTQEPKAIKITPLKDSSPHNIDTPKRNMTPPAKKPKKGQLRWHTPAEIRIDSSWRIGAGESSKEVEIQTQRNLREKETFYSNPQDIPPNPKEPWDLEMDFDDSLTPEIPIEQPPESLDSPVSTAADVVGVGSMTSLSSSSSHDNDNDNDNDSQVAASEVAVASSSTASNGQPEPDLELLAVLLKNPDVVFALTSGQGKSLTDEETVALLDLVKTSGIGLADIAASIPKETSLPSPTPPSNAATVGWRSEFPSSHAQIPHLQPQFSVASPTPTANPTAMSHRTMLPLPPQMTVPANHHRTPQQHLPLNPHSSYAPQVSPHNPNPEIVPHSNHRYPSNNNLPFPVFPPPPQNPQSHILRETTAYRPNMIPAWPPLVPDSRTGRPNELRNGPMYLPHNNDYNGSNAYPRRNEYSSGPEMEPRREFGRGQQPPEWPRQGNSGHHDQYRTGGDGRRWRDRDRDREWRR